MFHEVENLDVAIGRRAKICAGTWVESVSDEVTDSLSKAMKVRTFLMCLKKVK